MVFHSLMDTKDGNMESLQLLKSGPKKKLMPFVLGMVTLGVIGMEVPEEIFIK